MQCQHCFPSFGYDYWQNFKETWFICDILFIFCSIWITLILFSSNMKLIIALPLFIHFSELPLYFSKIVWIEISVKIRSNCSEKNGSFSLIRQTKWSSIMGPHLFHEKFLQATMLLLNVVISLAMVSKIIVIQKHNKWLLFKLYKSYKANLFLRKKCLLTKTTTLNSQKNDFTCLKCKTCFIVRS